MNDKMRRKAIAELQNKTGLNDQEFYDQFTEHANDKLDLYYHTLSMVRGFEAITGDSGNSREKAQLLMDITNLDRMIDMVNKPAKKVQPPKPLDHINKQILELYIRGDMEIKDIASKVYLSKDAVNKRFNKMRETYKCTTREELVKFLREWDMLK